AAEMKKYAKQIPGSSYAVDQRSNVYGPASDSERRGRGRACMVGIVSAEQDLLDLLQLHLAKIGLRVRTYPAGQDLLAAVRHAPPAILVVDALQRDGSAWDLCRQLRERKNLRHHPILLLSTD